MKTIYTIVLTILLVFPYLAKAQSAKIQELERETVTASGRDYIQKKLTLSELYLKGGQAKQAITSAEKAFSSAREIKSDYLQAKALNREAKGLIAQQEWPKANKRLERSQKILTKVPDEKALRFDNVYHLLLVAHKRAKLGDVTKAQNEIAILKGQLKLSDPEKEELRAEGIYSVLFPKSAELEKVAAEKQSLTSTVEELKEVKDELTSERELLEVNRVQLENLVVRKQNEIRQMTESQAKTELLVERQKYITDSLRYRGTLDSLNLAFRSHARILEEKNRIIEVEKERSEDLLLNILPAAIATELKENGEAKTRHYENVSVMFVDFKGFSKISKKMTTEDLIRELDTCFRAFDKIIQKYRLEKIKTIGDAYMCAGGLPSADNGSPIDVVKAALEIQDFLMQLKLKRVEEGKQFFEARIGIHTGPIIAGVVGLKKFAYDIWGDTVNVAARMETGCVAGKVNISGTTYEMIKEEFDCEYRGKVPAKNMGEVDMYFVAA